MHPDALLEAVLTAGVAAPDLASLRARLLDLVLAAVPADVAMLHALSPRVPLETAALRGVTLPALAAPLTRWDAAAVALAPLPERATALGLSLLHTSEPTRLRRITYAVVSLKKKQSQHNRYPTLY